MKLFLSIAFISLSQLTTAAFARTISGIVLSENDSTALAGAVCTLKLADGKTLETAIANPDGSFSVSAPGKSALSLEVGMTGFNPTDIMIKSGGDDINLGKIYLNEGKLLQEVVVSGDRMVESKGRTIIYPSIANVKASSTSLSLFLKLPLAGLDANPINRTLSVDGGTPMILINGVPSSMDDVNSIQAKEIEKIEYSRITPARYADQGKRGMISITLKKRNDGGSVYLWGRSATATAFMDGNFRASYHQGPSQFNVSYNPSWRNYKEAYDNSYESYIGDDFRVDLESHDRNPFNYFSNQMRLKYNFSPSVKTLFSATFNLGSTTNKSIVYGVNTDSFLGDYDNVNKNKGKDLAPSLDLFLRHDFNDKNSLEAQVVGTLSSNSYNRDNLYEFADGGKENYLVDVDAHRRSLISEVSYIHNFSDRTSLSGGFQNTVSHSKNKYKTTDYRPILTENNNYIYARLGQQVGSVYFSVASGAKMFWIKNDMNKRHFIRNLSTVQFNWSIDNKWQLAGAFQYSPSIPSLSSLTDYPQQTSPYLISNGNPNLKVAENFAYQLMPSFRYKKFNASLLMTYRNIKNNVISDLIYMGDHEFLSQSVNAKRSRMFYSNLNLGISDVAGFGARLNISFDYYESAGEGWSHDLKSVNGSMSVWWNKGPFTISYWRKFPGKYLNGHRVGKDENGDSFDIQYKPDSHWTLGASWMYMFDVKGTKYPSWNYSAVNPGYRERYIKNNGNMIVLSVTYSADFGSLFRSAKRSLNNSDNGSSILRL